MVTGNIPFNRGKENHNNRDEDASFDLIDQPLRTCYLEFSENQGLNFKYGNT